MATTDSSTPDRGAKKIACLECRKSHVKCHWKTSVCPRCTQKGLDCVWVASRRGGKGKSKQPPQQAGNAMSSNAHQQAATGLELTMITPMSTDNDTSSPPESSHSNLSLSSQSALSSSDDYLTNCYFTHFHVAHPILLPRIPYDTAPYPEHLKATVKFIGSHYATGVNISTDSLKLHVAALLGNSDDKTPEMVQTLLLCAIALHSRYEPTQAMSAIDKAATMAIELGMNLSGYAAATSEGNIQYEESLRRTWWEIFITDGYLAALHSRTNFRSNSVIITTMLPCEDKYYTTGAVLPPPATLAQFDSRLWNFEEIHFSSYSFRIDAVRILARVIAVSKANDTHADAIQSLDIEIASWKHSLPLNKAETIARSCDGDPLMFQAFAFIDFATILLHFPRSELPILMPPSANVSCAQKSMQQVSPTSSQHAARALIASRDIISLAGLPVAKHSPFLICGLVYACVVQLTAYCTYPHDSPGNQGRVHLALGVLRSFSCNWNVADFVLQKLRVAAHDVFNVQPEATGIEAGDMNGGFDFSTIPGLNFPWMNFPPYDPDMLNDAMMGAGMPGAGMPGAGMPGADMSGNGMPQPGFMGS
ncbi:unnamed protein product [Zymoseptoria tritici ST99CH_1A5]|uniref:Zn(2)-C6 fungal-type domain-containing protein n=2 Tax=Zymoseptoria tritici TaxID=1047171 RepID=A0A2H1GTW9_ZYMTR|nr:unnamed protein product [Zymoseptoria tritici ST99CH_1E4]SMY27038.1 unnamed protein product [Zymoseptoria tritici ST99CH_1A5]